MRVSERRGLLEISDDDHLSDGIALGLVVYRGLMGLWTVAAWIASDEWWERPVLGSAAVTAMAAFTIATAELARRRHLSLLLSPPVIGLELALAIALLALDPYVYADARPEPLGTIWPLAVILTIALVGGARRACLAGIGMGAGAFLLAVALGVATRWTLATTRTAVVYAVAGLAGGYVVDRIRTAERGIALAAARDEVARTLHDGVLQTLAVIQRRSPDADLVSLAQSQESELREYLTGVDGRLGDLEDELRAVAGRFELRYDGAVELALADDLGSLAPHVVAAIAGAAGEAVTNAGKHGGARRVVVMVEPDGDEIYCSVVDDGAGFDPSLTIEGMGLSGSVRGRITELGGRVEISSRLGEGTDVEFWCPR